MPEIRGGFITAADKLDEAARRGVVAACEYALASADERVPLETGTLARSGDYDVELVGSGTVDGSVYYDTVYARRQHEELTWEHAPGREAKWLERTFNRESSAIARILGQAIRTYMR